METRSRAKRQQQAQPPPRSRSKKPTKSRTRTTSVDKSAGSSDELTEDESFEDLTDKQKEKELKRLEKLRLQSEREAAKEEEELEPTNKLALSDYARRRLRSLACSTKELPLPRVCQMSLASLKKLSDFFVFVTDQYEGSKENQARVAKLRPAADKRWAKIKSQFLQVARKKRHVLACDLAPEVLPLPLRKKFEVLDTLAGGLSGLALRAYSLTRQQNEVLKISQPDVYVYTQEMLKAYGLTEFDLQQEAVRLGLSPKAFEVVHFHAANGVKMEAVSMEEMNLGLDDAIECALDQKERLVLAKALNKLLKAFNKHKVTHGDAHSGNFMVKYGPGPKFVPMVYAIDWARASFLVYRPDFDHLLLVAALKELFEDLDISSEDWEEFLGIAFRGIPVNSELKQVWVDDDDGFEDYYETWSDLRKEYKNAIRAAHGDL